MLDSMDELNLLCFFLSSCISSETGYLFIRMLNWMKNWCFHPVMFSKDRNTIQWCRFYSDKLRSSLLSSCSLVPQIQENPSLKRKVSASGRDRWIDILKPRSSFQADSNIGQADRNTFLERTGKLVPNNNSSCE